VDTPVTLGLAGFADGYAKGSVLWIINNIYFQYFSVFITLVSAVVMVGVSYLTKAPDEKQIQGLTFATQSLEDRQRTRDSWGWQDVLGSAITLSVIIAAYLYFRG
jgi:SSS family solute:Na+ symporter